MISAARKRARVPQKTKEKRLRQPSLILSVLWQNHSLSIKGFELEWKGDANGFSGCVELSWHGVLCRRWYYGDEESRWKEAGRSDLWTENCPLNVSSCPDPAHAPLSIAMLGQSHLNTLSLCFSSVSAHIFLSPTLFPFCLCLFHSLFNWYSLQKTRHRKWPKKTTVHNPGILYPDLKPFSSAFDLNHMIDGHPTNHLSNGIGVKTLLAKTLTPLLLHSGPEHF